MRKLAHRALRAAAPLLLGIEGTRALASELSFDCHLPMWRAQSTVRRYEGHDIDEFRARYGKAEGERRFFERYTPSSVQTTPWNILLIGGASNLFECLIGNGTSSSGQSLTYFNNANCYVGVGDSSTAEAATQTDLQASSNKYRNPADSTYPLHVDGSGAAATTITAATNASPISVTDTAHGYNTNDVITIAGVTGNTAANGTFQITKVDANTFTLNNSTGNGAYVSGGYATKSNVLVIQSTFGTANANFSWNEWIIANASSGGRALNRKQVGLGTKVSSASWALTVALALQ